MPIAEPAGIGQSIALTISNTNMEDENSLAYQTGFADGLEYGYEKRNKYKRDKERLLYQIGFDAGIKEYCREEYPKED